MYELKFDEKAIDFLARLPKYLRKRIYDNIIRAKYNPFHYYDRLEGRKEYKLRIGEYRVITDISKRVIEVRFIGHRKKVHKKF